MSGQVNVWIAQPAELDDADLLAAYERLMSDDERVKQRSFVFERNRREYLVSRALLRSTLSKYDAIEPEAWRFVRDEHGRPAIAWPSPLRFNLAHHPTMVVCAVTTGAALGIDVEPIDRGREILRIAAKTFAKPELDALGALPPEAAAERAVTLWTLKEAYIKARGLGLSLPLDDFAFSFDDSADPRIAFAATMDDRPERWAFRTRDVNGHRIALAVELGSCALEIRFHLNVPLCDSVRLPL